MTRKQPEELLVDGMVDVYEAHYTWSGPDEAKRHLMRALAHLAYADAMWRSHSRED